MKPIRSGLIAAVVAVATTHTGYSRAGPIAQRQPNAGTNVRVTDAYSRQPLGFEANRGQTDPAVQFVSRGAGYTLFLTSTEAVLALRKAAPETTERTPTALLRMKLVDSNPAPRVSRHDELPGKSNYIIGSDRRNWHTEVPRYGRVTYQDVYPGVDLVYYGNQQQLEYDFIVAPGADPDVIELAFEGAQDLHVDAAGDLLLDTGDGEVRLKTPLIYQETDSRRVHIPGGYRKTGSDRVAFHLGEYDPTRPLVVDPILLYSTYLGGSRQDFSVGIATDQEGAAYITGYALSVDFPTAGARQPACAGNIIDGYQQCEDAFITKLSRYLTLEYSTYFGGTSGDIGTGIAVRSDTGEATSPAGRARLTFRPPTRSTLCSAMILSANEPSRRSSVLMDPSSCTRHISVVTKYRSAETASRSIPRARPMSQAPPVATMDRRMFSRSS